MGRSPAIRAHVAKALAIGAYLLAAAAAEAADGALDPTFDGPGSPGNGRFVMDFESTVDDGAAGVARQTDGKLVVVGTSNGDVALARYNPDGSFDPTFDGPGTPGDGKFKVTIGAVADQESGADVLIQPGGKILVAGSAAGDMFVARLNAADGTLDTSFSGDGKLTIDFGGTDGASEIAFDTGFRSVPDAIVVAGTGNAPGFFSDFAMARIIASDGTLDPTFDGDGAPGNGKFLTSFTAGHDGASALTLLTSGDIVAAGHADFDSFALARYNGTDGTLDTGFDGSGATPGNGKVLVDIAAPNNNEGAADVVNQPGGKILAAGFADMNPNTGAGDGDDEPIYVRVNATDGTLDATFDGDAATPGNGIVRLISGSGSDEDITALVIQTDGKIVGAGTTQNPDNGSLGGSFLLHRLNGSDGTRDQTFAGPGGVGPVTTDFIGLGGYVAVARDMALGPDRKLTVVGLGDRGNLAADDSEFALARHLGDGVAPDTNLADGPPATTNDSTPSFQFTATEAGSTFECRLDSATEADFQPCSTGHTTAVLSETSHTFEVRAVDVAGNRDATPASSTFTVDVTPPDVTITSGPSGSTTDSSPSFTFGSTDAGSTFQCQLDAEALGPCTGPGNMDYPPLPDGAHTFLVRATDPVGNTSDAVRSFSIDPLAPAGATVLPAGSEPLSDPGPGPAAAPDVLAPLVTGFSVTNRRFAAGRAQTAVTARRRAPVGTVFRYTLSEAARVTIGMQLVRPGRRVGSRCVRQNRSNRGKRRCDLLKSVGTLTRAGQSGANTVAFSGRIGSRRLRPGRYLATVKASDAAQNTSQPKKLRFTVVAR